MAKEQDQSMEEILQSIKRIIAEEGEPAPSGSDVLELTDLLSEDDVSKLVDSGQDDPVGTLSIEEIMAAPIEPEEYAAAPSAPPQPAPPVARPIDPPAPVEAPAPKPEPIAPVDHAPRDEAAIVSESTIDKSAAALDALRRMPYSIPPIPPSGLHFRAGVTIEDLVLEAMRPMLKSWLDEYLPGMVERLVEKEVRRVSGRP